MLQVETNINFSLTSVISGDFYGCDAGAEQPGAGSALDQDLPPRCDTQRGPLSPLSPTGGQRDQAPLQGQDTELGFHTQPFPQTLLSSPTRGRNSSQGFFCFPLLRGFCLGLPPPTQWTQGENPRNAMYHESGVLGEGAERSSRDETSLDIPSPWHPVLDSHYHGFIPINYSLGFFPKLFEKQNKVQFMPHLQHR